eukprot:gnl/TRDRNA2_/TRDRNA2_182344_c0_seq1.p1 gnl/TRDRNA2_/TRDRNA2_182344_c0~~gnl/TRDRNA2_/TRDRNA2_182344_c0_seq1.p1  ORF type:complete len:229 (+),score=48.21 gnl/TRDRNA2_/TRDRNA2_182344_c0_seq1:71-688(+)
MAPSRQDIPGWYSLKWAGGEFEVCFRPATHFFCPKFQAASRWSIEDDTVKLDWGKFGKYEFKVADDLSMDGFCVGVEDPDKKWRKATRLRDLSAVEKALIGDGAGTEWELSYDGGKFPIQFKCDGYNHFKCQDFPAHAHWKLSDGNKLFVDWGEYGKYNFEVDGEKKEMVGAPVGKEFTGPEWRKCKFLHALADQKVVEDCEHHH